MNERKTSTNVAGVLSVFIPGLGQMYKGDVGVGILWLLATAVGYGAMIIPGLVIHVFCILNAFKEKEVVIEANPSEIGLTAEEAHQKWQRLSKEVDDFYSQHKKLLKKEI